jgi:filamentous hemagglutinin family protein
MRQSPYRQTDPARAILRLMAGVSVSALVLALSGTPAHAQLVRMRAAAGTQNPSSAATATTSTPVRPVTMTEALQRQQAIQTQAQQLAGYINQAQAAARAASQATNVTDGISANGLNPIAPVLAVTKINPSNTTGNAAPASTLAANDASGIATWDGATAPVQTTAGSAVTVTITQTQTNAVLSWQSFNVGTNTTLNFVQQQNGVAQPGWTVVNRVVNAINPSQILGAIKADGTVVVLNNNGVIFGRNAQVNLNSLIASSLELGNFASGVTTIGQTQYFVASTIADRNTAFLQNGLLVSGVTGYQGQILSALLPAGYYNVNSALPLPGTLPGAIMVEAGATINSGAGGFIILAGPSVTNGGVLNATDGQVSLQAGMNIGAVASSGSSSSVDPNVRGLVLSTQIPSLPTVPQDPTPDQGTVTNTGIIDSRRGYISLGTGLYGTVTNDGLLEATTSVSRNGKIALTGGTVVLGGGTAGSTASAIVILADDDGETIPQGTPDSPPSFNTSQVVIGDKAASYLSTDATQNIALFPSVFTMQANALIYAPSGNVIIGQDASAGAFALQPEVPSGVTIASGATIDVAGLMAVEVAASTNSVEISPAKQNELRDTPNYRSVSTDGNFTLNGQTLYVDARLSGTQSDGVAWQGSPLLEASSAISQIPVTAAVLMTKGGSISIDVGAQTSATNLNPSAVPAITIAKGAVFDIAGGWVTYDAGYVLSSELITSAGGAVNIANGDPNGNYVAVVNGFTAAQPHFGISQTYYNAAIQGEQYNGAYDEGRDAGALEVIGTEIAFDGTVYANAFAGANQLAAAQAASAASSINGDPRKLQYSKYQLPSGGLLRIGSFSGKSSIGLGQDIVVYTGTRGSDPSNPAELLLDAQMLSNAGLSALDLQTSGAVLFAGVHDTTLETASALTLTGNAALTLAAGGTLEVDAGRQIRFDGTVVIPGGTVAARTYQLTNVAQTGIGTVGNPFRSDDDIAAAYASNADLPRPFDITVNGTLDVSGLWTNDYINQANPQGAGHIGGGSISLTVAPRVSVAIGPSVADATVAGDISGSIAINPGALLDVSAGGYVSTKGALNLTASGGNVSLIDQTTYATMTALQTPGADNYGSTVTGQGVSFTPSAGGATSEGVNPALVVQSENSTVSFAPGTIQGFGFAGGGTFKLVSPDIAVNGGGDANATQIPLNFLQQTGFGTLDLTTYHASLYAGLFDNGSSGLSAFFDTTQVVVGAGQTLDLNQALLPTIIDASTRAMLLNLQDGAHVAQVLGASVPGQPWYQQAATLALHGLMELDVDSGGTITGAAQATIITPKLYNAGTITLPGGTIEQVAGLPAALNATGIGLVSPADGGTGFAAVFGAPNADGQYQLGALNSAGLTNTDGTIQTNNQIFASAGNEHFLYFTAKVAATDGIVLAAGSMTNLAGTVILNPVAPISPTGTMYTVGRIIDGGMISTAAAFDPTSNTAYALFANPAYGFSSYPDPNSASATPPPMLAQTAPRAFVAQPGSTLNVSGTAATLDVQDASGNWVATPEWSNGGAVGLLSGGTLSGATVLAAGGAPQATGATLEWYKPTIRGTDDAQGTPGVAFADQIQKAGFSTMIADGGLTLDGAFTLSLNAAFLVQSPASISEDVIGANAGVVISATPGTNATIAAPYINFSSRAGSVNTSIGGATGNATVTFAAGASGMDVMGGILFDTSIANLNLDSAADIRLIGIDDRAQSSAEPVLDGQLVAAGNITFDAARVYTTTGTGNLQRILQDQAGASDANPPSPYLLAALGTSSITFLGDHMTTATPYSAGSYLLVEAGTVTQNGYLAAPLGEIAFGTSANPIATVSFGKGSVTSVSGNGLDIPYGTTTDLSAYYFTPGTSTALAQLPSGALSVTATNITVAKGGTVDGAGGGDVFAYEFVSGTGGSRDVLSRFNTDPFSANHYNAATGVGYQYADQRQVYALVPAAEAAKIAYYDPLYSADYSAGPAFDNNGVHGPSNLYGAQAGLAVTLDGGDGIAAGQYVLMPAHYALLPGAYRIVENSGSAAPAIGQVSTELDGSIIMGGTFSTAGTNLASSQRVSFTIQSQATFLKYSDIQTTSGTTSITAAAAAENLTTPAVPLDAARVVLDPLAQLDVAGTFDMTPATGGRGSEIDILGANIVVNASGIAPQPGVLALSNATLTNLNANSLLIGGERTENGDDTTSLGITATSITIDGGAKITVPDLILAVAGKGSRLVIANGAQIVATGTLDNTRAGDLVIASSATPSAQGFDTSGIGSVLQVTNGAQRLVDRTGAVAAANANRASTINIGAATLTGKAVTIDTNNRFVVSADAHLNATDLALSANDLSFGAGGTISATFQAQLAAAANLTLASRRAITFDANATYTFNNLTLDTPGIGLTGQTGGADSLTINAGALRIGNSSGLVLACGATGAGACGTSGNTLAINATSMTFTSGTFKTYSFDGAVNLAASGGTYVEGAGQLALGAAALNLVTPFVIDRAAVIDPNSTSSSASDAITPSGNYTIPVTPNYVFATSGAVSLSAPALASGATAPVAAGLRAPGATIAFGSAAAPVASLSIDGTAVTATAGVIDIEATGSIALTGGASLSTPGYSRSYGDSQDVTTISAGGGTVNLVSFLGNISLAQGTAINVDNGTGNAGTINLIAADGAVALGATLDAGVTGPRTASLTLDSGTGAFDLDGFAKSYGTLFQGTLAIRSGLGDLDLAAGHTLTGSSVALTADGGVIDIAGTITTAGADISAMTPAQASTARVDGGPIQLWGMNGVTLESGALLDTHTSGYGATSLQQASAGDVTIGIGNTPTGAITLAAGSTINVSATATQAALAAGQSGNRLVAEAVENPNTLVNQTVYQFVAADTGGNVLLRAPVVGDNANVVNISVKGGIVGASTKQIEGYYTWNLDQIAANGYYDGVSQNGNGVALSITQTGNNILSDVFVGFDGTLSVPWFIQNFAITAADGSDLSSFRQRPGVNLVSSGDIVLTTNWNLAAGTLDTAGALAAGYLKAIPELGQMADGTPYYAVVSGDEGALLANNVSFLYRVGAKASGEAGIFTFNAGGNLDIQGSISDGFFTFADKSDPTWINYQLGGNSRTFDAALLATCGSGQDCSNIATYGQVSSGAVAAGANNTLTISLAKYFAGNQEGAATVLAPYDAAANLPDAQGSNIDPNTGNPSGDPVGFAQLFPLLPGGTAIHSSSIRLTAGAGAIASANPLHVDRSTNDTVTVEGETEYGLYAAAGNPTLGSNLDLKLALAGFNTAADPNFALDALLGNTTSNGQVDTLTADSYTSISWGAQTSGFAAEIRAAANSFFAGRQATFAMIGAGRTTGVSASLADMLAFLTSIEGTVLSDIANHTTGAPTGTLNASSVYNYGAGLAYSRTVVRTGDGTIDVASSGNVDLTNQNFNLNTYGVSTVYRNALGVQVGPNNPNGAQVGGTAIYTAGVRVPISPVMATITGTTTQIAVTPDSAWQAIPAQQAGFIPSTDGLDPQAAVLATGGGNVSIAAGGSVLAVRDDWSQKFLGSAVPAGGGKSGSYDPTQIGDASQRWRIGSIGQDSEIAIAPKYFTSGIGALGGGNVTIDVAGNVTDLTLALDSSVTTTPSSAGAVLMTFGRGDLSETIGGNLLAGQIDLANGTGTINLLGSALGYGKEIASSSSDLTQYLQVRVANADLGLTANGSIDLAGVSALGAANGQSSTDEYNSAGFYTANAGFSAIATGSLDYVNNRASQTVPFQLSTGNAGIFGGSVLPPSVTLAALTNTLVAREAPLLLYPSATGELNVFSAGDISSLVIAMSDSNPSLLPGAFSAASIELSSITSGGAGVVTPFQGLGFGIPGVDPSTPQALLYLYHDQAILHAGDTNPVHVYAGVDITNSLINVPKAAEVIAGRDIVNLYFTGQNLNPTDTTVIQAGRDILGTTSSSATFNLPYVVSSDYVLGGPGNLLVQAGRNLGPFINSAVVNTIAYPGGIQTVGNLYDPWLTSTGANLTVLFGVAGGIDYSAFEQAYLNPANFSQLDGSLFVQSTDALGNASPVRSEQIYAPVLAEWLRTYDPKDFAAIFGSVGAYPNTTAGNAALTTAAYGQSQAMYNAFITLSPLLQDSFLINDVYFNELAQAAEPTSPSYLQYYRGYWAIDTLFPTSLGYTDNLATYTVNPATVTANHPKGVPTRNLVNGEPVPATTVQTGNADLRLATLETASGGNITILGPGGTFIAGSVVRTSTQAADRVTRYGVDSADSLAYGAITSSAVQRISSIPIGYEGVLTLNGGNVDAFTDGSFLVNQSRVFTEAGGDIVMWSSNGNLNAGQGPRSASSFPPITVNTGLDGYSVVDSAGSVSGAGIGAFQRAPTDPVSSVILIAPAGLVDAGDAGVRATGDVLVAAAHVANADAFSAGGTISGVPSRVAVASTTPTSAASSAAAAQASSAAGAQDTSGRPSVITVDSLGFGGTAPDCTEHPDDPACKTT